MTSHRVALITGATGSLGRVLAVDLASEGYRLALVGSNAARLEAMREELGLESDTSMTVVGDLRDAASAAAVIDAVYERFGRVSALAHLVGGWTGGMSVAECPDEPYSSMIDQHLWTTLNVVRELTPRMARAGNGRVVAVSSPMAAAPTAGMSAYGVGKAAMETLLAGLAVEVRDQGVTVNVLRVRTIDASGDPPPGPAQVTTPSEISAAIRYLFSDAAGAITGQRIGMDRGRS